LYIELHEVTLECVEYMDDDGVGISAEAVEEWLIRSKPQIVESRTFDLGKIHAIRAAD
jgi:hypothetical protein